MWAPGPWPGPRSTEGRPPGRVRPGPGRPCRGGKGCRPKPATGRSTNSGRQPRPPADPHLAAERGLNAVACPTGALRQAEGNPPGSPPPPSPAPSQAAGRGGLGRARGVGADLWETGPGRLPGAFAVHASDRGATVHPKAPALPGVTVWGRGAGVEAPPRARRWWRGQQSRPRTFGSAWSSQKRLRVPGHCLEPAGSSELAASPSTETKAEGLAVPLGEWHLLPQPDPFPPLLWLRKTPEPSGKATGMAMGSGHQSSCPQEGSYVA